MASLSATLKNRSDFLAMNAADRWVTPGFIVQYRPSTALDIGYTVSKKVGNAVTRNRVKRRLRSLAAETLLQEQARIVLIGRPDAYALPFASLQKDLKWALRRLKQRQKPA